MILSYLEFSPDVSDDNLPSDASETSDMSEVSKVSTISMRSTQSERPHRKFRWPLLYKIHLYIVIHYIG